MLRVLLLDDNPDDVLLATRALRRTATLQHVSSREKFDRALDEPWDVLLIDWNVPGFSGPEAIALAKRRCPRTPIVILSGSITDELASQILSAQTRNSVMDFVLKDRLGRLPKALETAHRLKKLELQQLRAQRMEMIGAMASGIAHDLNNILIQPLCALEFVRATVPAEKRWMLDRANAALMRGGEMTRQMLAFVRGGNGYRPLELAELIRELIGLMRPTFPKTIQIKERIEPVPKVEGDYTQIHQVLLNLCLNARDAMPKGGMLRIGAEPKLLSDHRLSRPASGVHPASSISGRFAQISVTDDGCGMTPAIAAKIFDPFFTTKGDKGTGLGLSIVEDIVRAHAGHIDLVSIPGQGTTFFVFLPAAARDGETPAQPYSATPHGRGELILVVDDEVFMVEMLEAMLMDFNYRVLRASGGAEGLELYRERSAEIAAVVIDLVMPPPIDGSALIRELRALNPAIKVVAISGMQSALAALGSVGADATLHKPFTGDRLLAVLDELLTEEATK